jgi:hypothetical protein
MIGWFLFATHTTVCSGTLWYQIPRYLLLELPGLKNPSAKLFPSEIRRSPSLMVWFVFKESRDVQDEKWSIKREKSRNSFSASMMKSVKFCFVENGYDLQTSLQRSCVTELDISLMSYAFQPSKSRQ